MAILLTMSGIVLLFSAFWVDPQGEIDSSILVAFGEISTFAGALLGVIGARGEEEVKGER